jgi:tetratricopeptide (TPR) repeat protein
MSSAKPIILISYAHADEPEKPRGEEVQWLSFVMRFLRPAVKSGAFTMWVDRQMPGGTEWDEDIDRELRACDVFVLLVSASSMGSDYIIDKELEIARVRRAAGELYIYPLLIRPTPRAGVDRVREFNLRPRDAKPFSSYSLNDLEQHMSDAADEIADVAKGIAEKKAAAAAEQAQISKLAETARIAAAMPGWQAAVPLSLDIDGKVPNRPATAPPISVAISGLPETFYERLVGRDAELARLDSAWSDEKTNIVSLVAEGGAGKSALVNEWLTRMQANQYGGADSVLGWSFFSQGSNERATSADEFLNWALAKLGVKLETTSAAAKGEAIAEALMTRRALLVLDGVEPLQHGPGPQTGQLKDQGLRALLRRFGAAPPKADHSLILLTSRLAVADIQRFRNGAVPVVDVERLSDEAGAELLRDNDVWGVDRDLKRASHDFGGHPLALTLLASLIKETQNGDVRRRDHIRGLLADADNPRHDQARRVMESYEKEWLAGQPILLAILQCVGLFDRPASGDCLKALRARPAIPGLTDALVGLSEEQWRRAVERLREARLLAPVDPSDPEGLDAHPLVREWFGERLQQTDEAAWKEAHSRVYDHLRDTTREGKTPTLADLAPLYHAVAHGCRAGRHQEALDEVYRNRIYRRLPDGKLESYAFHKLGAIGSNLGAISWFFDRPYETPAVALTPPDRAWVLSEASFALRAQRRLREALPAWRVALRTAEEAQHWANAATRASNLSQAELIFGDVAAAVSTAEKAVALADRTGNVFQMMAYRTDQADAIHAAGECGKAAGLFADAERLQREQSPEYPLMTSLQGYFYCDLLLSLRRAAEARDRAAQTIEVARRNGWVLDVALDTLTIGRAHLAQALQSLASASSAETTCDDARTAAIRLDGAVEGLRAAGTGHRLPRGLLARAAFRCAVGDWDGAARDLTEVWEIAEPGPMRLFLCDCALERARLALARREAFAPLNRLVEPSPPPPALPDAVEAARLLDAARKELNAARELIADCGYHRRDAELAELDAVAGGKSRFADLPPRV